MHSPKLLHGKKNSEKIRRTSKVGALPDNDINDTAMDARKLVDVTATMADSDEGNRITPSSKQKQSSGQQAIVTVKRNILALVYSRARTLSFSL